MSFYHISAKTFTVLMVYMIIVYTMMFGVFGAGTGDPLSTDFVVGVEEPRIGVRYYNTSYNSTEAEEAREGKENWFTSVLFAFIAGAIAIAIVFTGGLASIAVVWGLPTALGIVASSAAGGAFAGYVLSDRTNEANIDLPWDPFVTGIASLFGAVLTFLEFILSFLTFGLIGNAFEGVPTSFGWIVFIMVFPAWFYIMLICAGFSVDAWNSIKRIL